jgi:hypothetical protein
VRTWFESLLIKFVNLYRYASATCAALVVASSSPSLLAAGGWAGLMFPVTISAAGILVCLLCSFVATAIRPVKKEADIETVLKVGLYKLISVDPYSLKAPGFNP